MHVLGCMGEMPILIVESCNNHPLTSLYSVHARRLLNCYDCYAQKNISVQGVRVAAAISGSRYEDLAPSNFRDVSHY